MVKRKCRVRAVNLLFDKLSVPYIGLCPKTEGADDFFEELKLELRRKTAVILEDESKLIGHTGVDPEEAYRLGILQRMGVVGDVIFAEKVLFGGADRYGIEEDVPIIDG